MLVLSRKLGEAIVLGEGITVSVVRIDGRRVQLGIEAPRDVSVVRDNARSIAKEGGADSPRSPAIPR